VLFRKGSHGIAWLEMYLRDYERQIA